MTPEQATEKAIEWNNLHNGADAEDSCGCHAFAETLRMKAADLEMDLRDAGFDAFDLIEAWKRKHRG